jgi:hypothetical protein
MPGQFFSGQVRLLLKRCRSLRRHLGTLNSLPAELQTHVEELDKKLEDLDQGIQNLLADPDFGAPPLFFNQADDYKRYVEIVNVYEWHPLALLDHYNHRDHHFYRFVKLLCEQVRYPYPPPLVSAHSSEYFFSSPLTNMIGLPLIEQHFLLALADLLHELGHLFYLRHGHVIQQAFAPLLKLYITELKQRALDESSSKAVQRSFDFLDQVWQQRYVTEFSCDMFATYLVGQAYGWSHLRLVLATRTELYHPGFGEEALHPADEARMRAILITLEELGGTDDSCDISQKWEQFKEIVVDKSDGEYEYCYPDRLLKGLAQEVIAACESLGLVPYTRQPDETYNLPSLLRKAWERFHLNPEDYDEWETKMTEALESHLSEMATASLVST